MLGRLHQYYNQPYICEFKRRCRVHDPHPILQENEFAEVAVNDKKVRCDRGSLRKSEVETV